MATNPTLLTMPIAENGQKNTIPATQAAAGDGLLSQSTGFPPETALPLGAGGKAPSREDFNGAFNLLSDIAFYAQKGWFFQFDNTQAYFEGCVVRDTTDGNLYEAINDVSAGGDAPSTDSDNWKPFFPVGKSIGEIFPYAGTTQPAGALLCNGAAVSRTMYSVLFDEIGTKYGSGDGSTTFNLPNLIDAVIPGDITKTAYETAGSATFTAPKSGLYRITVKGAGGGGQGGTTTSTYGRTGGGGGEGGTTVGYEHLTAGDTVAVVIGAGGAGGAKSASIGAVGSSGSNGGDTTATINLTTYTGFGGIGSGSGSSGGSGTINGLPGQIGSIATTGGTSAAPRGGGPYQGKGSGGNGGTAAPNNLSNTSDGQNGYDGYVWIEYLGDATAYYIQAFSGSTDPALVDLTQIVQDLANRLTREQTPAFNHRDEITTSGTYTAPVTGWYRIVVKGGGAGGQGGNHTSSANTSGSGGGEGGTTIGFEKMTAGDTATVVIGAGGSGGATGSGSGGAGGDSSVTVNNNTYTGGGAPGTRGGSGTIPGARGTLGWYVGTSATANSGVGAGSGGGNNTDGSGILGGGGNGGSVSGSTPTTGKSGGDGYATFEYFDGSLN